MSLGKGLYSFREKSATRFCSFALELVPASSCQLRCENCYKVKLGSSRPREAMPLSFAAGALDQAAAAGFSEAAFIGGEPTLHPDLPALMRHALARGLEPILCTNGIRLVDPGYADTVAIPGATLVMHAPLPERLAELHDQHVSRTGYNRLLRRAFDNVAGRDQVTVVAELVLLEKFLSAAEEVLNWCRARGMKPLLEMNRRHDPGVAYAGSASPEAVGALFDRLRSSSAEQLVLAPPAYGIPCTMSISGLHVKNHGGGDWGGIYSCCAQHIRHGDLRVESLAEVLARPSLRVFQDQDRWIHGPCRDCELYTTCRGGCRGESFLAFGCPRASCPSCWRIPAEVRVDAARMVPASCASCPLEQHPGCSLRDKTRALE